MWCRGAPPRLLHAFTDKASDAVTRFEDSNTAYPIALRQTPITADRVRLLIWEFLYFNQSTQRYIRYMRVNDPSGAT
jgi:hypothetical protein